MTKEGSDVSHPPQPHLPESPPDPTEDPRWRTFDQLRRWFTDNGLPGDSYTVPAFEGYRALTGGPVDVHCLVVSLGPSPANPSYDSYAVAQSFLPGFPSIALVFLVELRRVDRRPNPERPVFNIRTDGRFARLFLKKMHTALNPLDLSGGNRGLLVQSYNASMTLADLLQSTLLSLQLLFCFKKDGQLAQIAVDYDHPLIVFVAKVIRPLIRFVGDVHLFPKTTRPSDVRIPLRRPDGGYYLLGTNSTALDEGVNVAKRYMEKHYETSGFRPSS